MQQSNESSGVKVTIVEADKIGSVVSGLALQRTLAVVGERRRARVGDVLVVRALTDSATYNQLELPSGRLAKVNPGDVIVGALGRRRALKGFVGDVPETAGEGDRLHLLNMGGVIGCCTGHHSSLSDAIEVEVLGFVYDEDSNVRNIKDGALPLRETLPAGCAPLVIVAGACMNSGKTFAATEIVRQATRAGVRVAAGKLSGVAALRDTLNMADHGAVAVASFLDCGLPSTVGVEDLAPVAKAVIAKLNESAPDLIIIELGDGILGGYSVESLFDDAELREATAALLFCASDYVGAWGGVELFKRRGINVDAVAGSVTDSQMGEDYIEREMGVPAGNAKRNGARLFELIKEKVSGAGGRGPESDRLEQQFAPTY
ncbi:MAG TPA: hypothetical protein VEX60_11085 [Pyrinomonadaceae bacterium]|nr:hypothetical protein [Pyrinomonadaceae bacterium]